MKIPLRRKVIFYILLVVSAFLVFAPALIAFMMSFMTNQDIMSGKLIPTTITFDNYLAVFERFPLLNYLLNSFIVSIVIMIGQLMLSSLAAYAFVFMEFKGRNFLFFVFISTMMVPFEASVIPNFQTIRDLNLIDSYAGLTLPYFAMAFGTFLLRQNFKQIPK